MKNYELNVPVTTYHKVKITKNDLISLLEQEQKQLCGKWDCIVSRQGTYVYYQRGYGSHDIGEEYSNEPVEEKVLEAYQTIEKVIDYLKSK